DGFAILRLDGDVFHPLDQGIRGVGVQRVVDLAELGVAGGQEDVVVVQGVHDVHRRQVAGLQLLPVQVGQHGPQPAAIDHRRHRSGGVHDHVADLVTAGVVQDGLRLVLAVQGDQADRGGAGRVEGEDDRRQGARRQVGDGGGGERVDLGEGTVGVHVVAVVV